MIIFSNRESEFKFEHAFFSKMKDKCLPPAVAGCYMIIDKNVFPQGGIGEYSVIYVGNSRNIKNRIFGHACDNARFKSISRWRKNDINLSTFEILFIRDVNFGGIQYIDKENEKFSDIFRLLERKLKFLFVPSAPCKEDLDAIELGIENFRTNQINIDLISKKISWAWNGEN